MPKYMTSNNFRVRKLVFDKFDAHLIKTQREDFDDMFKAEASSRAAAGDMSLVFVLTYNDGHLRSKYGQNLLDSDDLKVFAKSSAWSKSLLRHFGFKFDFVCVGEYGNGGESHGVNGKRGKGQNPHFHCVGWFHRVADLSLDDIRLYCSKIFGFDCSELSLYDCLTYFVRFAWQGSLIGDIEEYASNKAFQTCGLGFVKLDGEIKNASRGGSYISKYIGKDIRTLIFGSFSDSFGKFCLDALVSACRECFSGRGFVDTAVLRFANLPAIVKAWVLSPWCAQRMNDKDFIVLKKYVERNVVTYCPRFLDCHMAIFDDFLGQAFEDFRETFFEDLRGRYSPKVRKFHRFGYSLLDYSDPVTGTYTIHRAGRDIMRMLPASLCRAIWYDHSVYTCERVGCKSNKVVRYTLNELGRLHLKQMLFRAVEIDSFVAKSKGSENLRIYAREASIFRNCLHTFIPTLDEFKLHDYNELLHNGSAAIEYGVNCRGGIVETLVKETRAFVDVDEWLRDNFPKVWSAYKELDEIRLEMRKSLENKDLEYIQSWIKCYDYHC